MTAHDLAQMRKKIIKVSSGSKSFDAMLGGGIQSMSISEVYGEYRESCLFLTLHPRPRLTRPRIWQDTTRPHNVCYGPASQGDGRLRRQGSIH